MCIDSETHGIAAFCDSTTERNSLMAARPKYIEMKIMLENSFEITPIDRI